ncbi:MAG: SPOR domain-containing protein [Novosphingobium sp.]
MKTNSLRPMALRFAVGSVLGAALLAGAAYGDASAKDAKSAETVQLKKSDEKAVAKAELAVAKSPQDAALRAELGQSYLRAGRFASASGAFGDAVALGDGSARTALGLALAQVADGRNRDALNVLEGARGGIPAGDLGLAVALAGETGRGVAILSDALRGGENTPKLRQNLAYAYALNGNWREARTMMAQDVPAEQLDSRMTQWVVSGHPDYYQQRVAALLGAPVRADPGMPAGLALNAAPAVRQAAVEAPSAPAPAAELPPVEQALAAAPAPVPAAAPAPVSDYLPAQSATTAPAFAAPVAAPAPHSLAGFEEFARPVASTLNAPAPRAAAARASRVAALPTAGGDHVIQLGSFSSEANARRAWNILVARNPELKHSRMVITPAQVNGRNFWRVAAASYDRSSARGLCSTVRSRGGACFAYAASGAQQNLAMARTRLRSGGGLALAR